jgi:3-oxoadipate enol-lactonase
MAAHVPGKLHWEQHGKHGPWMFFAHANPYDHRLWLYQTAHFSNWFRTFAVDLPAYGRSPAPTPGLTPTDIAEACWEALDEVTREPVILVGNSVGAAAAVFMTGLRPRQVRALILTGTGYLPDRTIIREAGAPWERIGMDARSELMQMFVSPARRNDPRWEYQRRLFLETNDRLQARGIHEMFRALEAPEPEAIYDSLNLPCLIITGTEDVVHKEALALQRRIRNAELVSIQGGGHVSNLDFPEEWDRAATDFLRRHRLFDLPSSA